MNTTPHPPLAVLTGTGNPQTLGKLWLAVFFAPDDRHAINRLATALDSTVRTRMPNGSLDGLLEGAESEVRQNALLLLLDRLLLGNSDLIRETQARADELVEPQIARTITAALKFAMRRLRRHLVKESARWTSLPNDESKCGSVCASPDRTLFSLPYAILVELALSSLQRGVEEKRLRPGEAAIARTIIDAGLSQADVARRLGISRAAVHQRLAPARRFLQRDAEKQELEEIKR